MKNKITYFFKIIVFFIFVLLLSYGKVNAVDTEEKYIYLSDLTYEENSYVAWSEIILDKNIKDEPISIIEDNEKISFSKGIFAHASSSVIYNISEYSNTYTRFASYIGVDSSRGNSGNGVIFEIYTSVDGTNWEKKHTSEVLKGDSNAEFINIDIKDTTYLRLDAKDNGSNGNDHSVYADARILKEGYDIESEKISGIKKANEYDLEIKEIYDKEGTITEELKDLILKRTFVQRYGYQTLNQLAKTSENNKEALNYIFENKEVLNYFVTGGEKDGGSYINILNAWCKLYETYRNDWIPQEDNNNSNTYLKMAISLSIANAKDITFWNGTRIASNPIDRYEIYKYMFDEGYFNLISNWSNEKFSNLPIELMRWVLNNAMHDDELLWLHNFSQQKDKNILDAYTYIAYTSGYNYNKDKYYVENDEFNYNYWNNKYNLDDIHLLNKPILKPYGTRGIHRLWIIFEEGSVCGGLAKTYANLRQIYGMPAGGIGQPGHAATLALSIDDNNQGKWSLLNNISGWPQSEKGERMPLGWGSTNWDSYYNVSYILLAQNAINHYSDLEQAMYYNYLANTYSLETDMQIEIYNKALEKEGQNLDAFVGIINAYKNDSTKTSADYLKLANRITTEYTYFPLPMVDLLNLIKDNISEGEDQVNFDLMKGNALLAASKATNKESLQDGACRDMANSLLKSNNVEIATFSFDGENAGKILISDKYQDSSIRIRYSLRGVENFEETAKETSEHIITLTPEELASINADDDIVIGFVGTNDKYTIDITQSNAPTNQTVYKNDLENRFIGNTDYLEYSIDNKETWFDYSPEVRFPNLQVVNIRYKSHGTVLKSESAQYTFTEDIDTDNKKYITIDNIELYQFSSQQNTGTGAAAKNLIDGTENTAWHTTWAGEQDKFYSVKFNEVKYISAIDYVPAGQNGRFKSGKVYSSMDGENWELVQEFNNFANNTNMKTITLDNPAKGQYIKIEITESYGNSAGEQNKFATGKMLNFYEDITIGEPTAEISYSITEETEEPVIATLINPSREITITNNEGKDTYTFETNGEFTFEFEDKYGNKGSVTAKVDWIIQKEPEDKFSSEKYEIDEEYISKIKPGTTFIEIKENIDTNRTMVLKDKNGNILDDTTELSTGMILQTNGDKEYILVVTGDIDQDGQITINDIAKLKLHLINYQTLVDADFKAADMDRNNMLTINDIAQMKLVLIGLMEVK